MPGGPHRDLVNCGWGAGKKTVKFQSSNLTNKLKDYLFLKKNKAARRNGYTKRENK